MYCKRDYVEYFLKINLLSFTYNKIIDLFTLALRNDSMRIAIQIYLRFICKHGLSQPSLDILLATIENSNYFHEEKLFFLHDNFNKLSVGQLDHIVDIFSEIITKNDVIKNPALYQYNTVKYSLLIYRICWKIENKNLYALITKCKRLCSYIEKSLNRYMLKQSHISQLYNLMHEPVLDLKEKKDSLDLIYEMQI